MHHVPVSLKPADPRRSPPDPPLRNRYLYSPYDEPMLANPWDVREASATPVAECDYFRHVFLELERSSNVEGLTFLVTSSVRSIPIVGDDVVVLVLQDEWARTPAFAGDVLAVLKCYGSRPWFPWRSLLHPSPSAAAGLANHARIRAAGVGHRLSSGQGFRKGSGANVLPVPLGWFKEIDVPWVDYFDRLYDASFVGSVAHDMGRGGPLKRTAKRLLGNPKILSRRQLISAVDGIRVDHPEWALRVDVSGNFHDVGVDQATAYSELMMSSKFSLAPRGTSLETFRFFEAIRFGTVPICEPLPPRWFYAGAPVPVIDSWSRLPELLRELLSNDARQQELHSASLDWWRKRCAPSPVAQRVDDWLFECKARRRRTEAAA